MDHTLELAKYLSEAGDAVRDSENGGDGEPNANATTTPTLVPVILSTLVTSPNPAYERCIQSFNAQIRQAVADLVREGRHIALADMHWGQGLPGRPGLEDIQADEMLPTRDGWRMMSEVLKTTIREVEHKGWLQAPVGNDIPADGDAERGG